MCPTLCNPMDGSLPGSTVHGIFQASFLEWATISFSRGSSKPRDRTRVSWIADRSFTVWASREVPSYIAQSCLTLCNLVDCSLPGSSVYRIFQASVLERVTISFSRGSSRPRNRTRVSHTVGRRFTVWATESVKPFPKVITSFNICTCIVWEFSFLYVQANTWHGQTFKI